MNDNGYRGPHMARKSDGRKRIEQRKADHIDICLRENVRGEQITSGFEKYRFRHKALPEVDFKQISLSASFLGKTLKAPFVISSMTGGTERARLINRTLAAMAEQRGWAMGLGSIRAALEHEELAGTFQVRDAAPSIPLLANLGAVQLNYGFTAEHCLRALELVQADGLVLHLNSLQEVFQPEGNTNFQRLLSKIEELCRRIPVPVGVKEVGWGIAGDVASQLHEAGVRFIDVAGAGGTSWSQVEKFRTPDKVKQEAAKAFADWGIPTAECVREVREAVPGATIIASGGIDDGVQAAKAIALGADLVGIGRKLLFAAAESKDFH